MEATIPALGDHIRTRIKNEPGLSIGAASDHLGPSHPGVSRWFKWNTFPHPATGGLIALRWLCEYINEPLLNPVPLECGVPVLVRLKPRDQRPVQYVVKWSAPRSARHKGLGGVEPAPTGGRSEYNLVLASSWPIPPDAYTRLYDTFGEAISQLAPRKQPSPYSVRPEALMPIMLTDREAARLEEAFAANSTDLTGGLKIISVERAMFPSRGDPYWAKDGRRRGLHFDLDNTPAYVPVKVGDRRQAVVISAKRGRVLVEIDGGECANLALEDSVSATSFSRDDVIEVVVCRVVTLEDMPGGQPDRMVWCRRVHMKTG
jgi:hypothetical protein